MSTPSVRRALILEALIYLGIALGAVGPALLRRGEIVGDGVDMFGTFWFYWWIGDCIEHLRDPSFTDLMFYPLGKDIFAHTGNNFVDAVLSWPFQKVFGFPDYQPWFVLVVMVGNALSFRPLARDLLRSRAAVVAATALWEVSPFVMFELMTGRITQALLWFLPLAVRHFLHIGGVDADSRLPGAPPHPPRWRDPVLAGVFTGLQAWTYWFMGWFMALLFGWLAVVELLRSRGRRRWSRARLGGWLVAGLACGVVVAPGVVSMAMRAAMDAVPGMAHGGGIFDKPEPVANNVARTLHGYWLAETRGQPMFAYLLWGGGLAVAALVSPDRLRWVGAWVVAIAFAVGPVIPVGDGIVMPHYMLAYRYLPFFDRLWFPMRLVVIAMLAATVLLGQLVDRLDALCRKRWPRMPAAVLPAIFIGLGLWEQHRVLAFPLIHRDLTPPRTYEVIGELGGGLIELPMGLARVSIAWQPVHQQPTFGGMGENAPVFHPPGYRRRLANPFIVYLRRVTRDPETAGDFPDRAMQALVDEGFRWVVLDRQLVDSEFHKWSPSRRLPDSLLERAPFLVQDAISARLGPPAMVEGRLVTWDLVGGAEIPDDLRPTPASLYTRTWPQEEMPEYELWLRARGRIVDGGPAGGGTGQPAPRPSTRSTGSGRERASGPKGAPATAPQATPDPPPGGAPGTTSGGPP
ncbi:MAG: hypothetical protein D6798_15220 [Deltaproteobacteria bacterium]|nr:MAG: hypothetical protein D6798_15220 [Deltaproteobacteria bacterium]